MQCMLMLTASGFVCLYITVIASVVVIIGSNVTLGPCSNQPNGLLINNLENCGAFWRCQDGMQISEQCQSGFNFHEPSQSCVTPDVYECIDNEDDDDDDGDDDDDDDGDGGGDTTQGIDTTLAPITPPPTEEFPENELEPICYGLPDGHFANNIAYCRSFYVCMNGFAIGAQCPDGYNFNEDNQSCDNHIDFPCFDEETHDHRCPETGIYAYEEQNSCEQFNFCFAGTHSYRQCADGLHFNSIDSRCDFPETAGCYRNLAYDCPSLNDPNNIVTHTSPTSCDEYFICYSGELRHYRCAPGLHWSQADQNCGLPENSECQPATDEPGPFVECPDLPGIHLIPHLTDCDKYYACSNGNPIPLTCLEGFLFDSAIPGCQPAAQVNCALV